MIVDVVSPTPYALLRRAKNFEYRNSDRALQEFTTYDDPVQALTDECRRVLSAISSANQSNVSNAQTSTSLADPSWSRFEDIGFGSTIDEEGEENMFGHRPRASQSLNPQKGAYTDLARPTTPSWADFLSAGFTDENGNKAPTPILLPPDKILPPLSSVPRGQSSQSHRRNLDVQPNLEPGELASIANIDVDDAFWWVWISSLAGEEPTSRKAVFGRCALIETVLPDGRWMVMEEQVKGAAAEPAVGTYIAEKKKSFFGFTTKRGKLTRRRSGIKKDLPATNGYDTNHRATLAPDQQARIQQVAEELSKKKTAEVEAARRREADKENIPASNRNSVFTLGPMMKDEISPAMQWAKQYDKKEIRAQYLGDNFAGKGSTDLLTLPSDRHLNRSTSTLSSVSKETKELPAPPQEASRTHLPREVNPAPTVAPPALPREASRTNLPRDVAPAPTTAAPPPPREASRTNLPRDITPAPTTAAPEPPVTVIEPAPAPPEPQALPPVPPEIPVEAAETPLPTTVPSVPEVKKPGSSGSANKLRKSIDGGRRSPEERRNRRPMGPPPVQKSGGIRRLFGTKRSRSREPEPRVAKAPSSPVETNPAILAARRALEGKASPAPNGTDSPPLSPNHFHRMKNAKSPTAAVQTVKQPSPAPARPVTPPSNRASTPEPEPQQTAAQDLQAGPPRTQRDEEYDQLSRVDTNEREHADREFSTFDQGPLVDQPAFVPEESPSGADTPEYEDAKLRQNHQSIYSAVTVPAEESEPEEEELTKQTSPQDRWAQIRKNAAERAARQNEEQTNRSRTETRTDDGETSGEESKSECQREKTTANGVSAIESRVARIKARVAELTGNMEATRR